MWFQCGGPLWASGERVVKRCSACLFRGRFYPPSRRLLWCPCTRHLVAFRTLGEVLTVDAAQGKWNRIAVSTGFSLRSGSSLLSRTWAKTFPGTDKWDIVWYLQHWLRALFTLYSDTMMPSFHWTGTLPVVHNTCGTTHGVSYWRIPQHTLITLVWYHQVRSSSLTVLNFLKAFWTSLSIGSSSGMLGLVVAVADCVLRSE